VPLKKKTADTVRAMLPPGLVWVGKMSGDAAPVYRLDFAASMANAKGRGPLLSETDSRRAAHRNIYHSQCRHTSAGPVRLDLRPGPLACVRRNPAPTQTTRNSPPSTAFPRTVCFRGAPPTEALELKVMRKAGLNGNERLRLFARGERVSYSGVPRQTQGEEMLVGVRKRGSEKVLLVRLAAPFVMEAAAVGAERLAASAASQAAAAAAASAAEASESQREGREGRESLVSMLGSEKARKRLQRNASKVVKADAVLGGGGVNELVRSALEAADAGADAALSEQQKRPAHPRFDLAATSARAAYPREGLVPEPAWAALDAGRLDSAARSTDALAGMEKDEVRFWPALVLRVLKLGLPAGSRGGSSTRGGDRVDTLKALLYLTYVCRFHTIKRPITPATRPAVDGGDGGDGLGGGGGASSGGEEEHPQARKLGIPMGVWRELLLAFTDAQGGAVADDLGATRRLTATTKQKLAMHAMALAIWIGEGKGDCTEVTLREGEGGGYMHTYMHTYVYIAMYLSMCVCT